MKRQFYLSQLTVSYSCLMFLRMIRQNFFTLKHKLQITADTVYNYRLAKLEMNLIHAIRDVLDENWKLNVKKNFRQHSKQFMKSDFANDFSCCGTLLFVFLLCYYLYLLFVFLVTISFFL